MKIILGTQVEQQHTCNTCVVEAQQTHTHSREEKCKRVKSSRITQVYEVHKLKSSSKAIFGTQVP